MPVKDKTMAAGTYELNYNVKQLKPGEYYAVMQNNNETVQSVRFTVID